MMTTKTDWLKQRKELLTASDVASVLGESPFKGGIDVYLDKIDSTVNDEEYALCLAYGHDVEEAIAKAYAHHTCREYVNPGDYYIHKHPDIPWLGATLDRVTWKPEDKEQAESGALECKSEGGVRRKEGRIVSASEWQADPHTWQVIQNQIQMHCAGFNWGSLAAMFPGYDLRYVDIERDNEFLEIIYPILDEFWGYVQRREPPPLKFQETKKLEAMKKLWNRENGETIPLTHEQMELIDLWELKKQAKKEIENETKDLEAQIYEMMKDAAFGALPDGTILCKKVINKKEYISHHKATSYPQLRRQRMK